MKNYFIFSPDAITVNGHKFAAEYRIISASRVNITVNYPDCAPGSALIVVEKSDPRFSAVAAAARGEYPEIYITGGDDPAQAADAPETFEAAAPAAAVADDPAQTVNAPETFEAAAPTAAVADDPAQAADAPETFEAAAPAAPAADDPAPVVNAPETFEAAPAVNAPETFEAVPAVNAPETFEAVPAADARKTFDFVGTEIAIKYGRILFDAVADRTRVILENADAATIETVKAAGFYYSKVMKSYNKKLTVKAYRAAVALAAQLNN